MYNDYYLLKRIEEEQGAVSFASVQDSFTYKGKVFMEPKYEYNENYPHIGDVVIFLKGSGEDVQVNGETMKVVKLEDIIMKTN